MVSEYPSSMANDTNVAAEKPVDGSLVKKKNQGRVPKKIHKAEREKLKRDQLNELFLELGHILEPAQQNKGKAIILGDASRILQDLFAQVESLRKENASLLTESSYVTAEKNELRDENSALQAEIAELKNELQGRMQSDCAWSNSTDMSPTTLPQPVSTVLPMQQQQPPVIRPVYATPIRELQLFPESPTTPTQPTPSSNVRRPHARYPTPSDSWPGQLLSGLPRTAREEHLSSTSSISTSSSREEGSDKA